MSVISIAALLVFLTSLEGSVGDHEVIPRCQCIEKERRPIGKHIEKLEVIPVSSHCNTIEIIATLKKDGKRICLDPDAPWLKTVLQRHEAGIQKRKVSSTTQHGQTRRATQAPQGSGSSDDVKPTEHPGPQRSTQIQGGQDSTQGPGVQGPPTPNHSTIHPYHTHNSPTPPPLEP